jgi:hypothetical protein
MTHALRFAAVAAAAFLPLAAAPAQEAQPAPPPPSQAQPVDVPAPPPPAPRSARPPAADPAPVADDNAPAPPPRVRAARPAAAPRTVVLAPPPPPATTTTTTTAVTPPVAVVPTVPPATLPSTTTPETLNAAPPGGIDTVAPPPTKAQQPQLDQRTAIWPWFVLAALVLGAAAILLLSRRRRGAVVYDRYEEEAPRVAENVPVAPPVVVPPAPEPEPAGVPAIALAMRPLRAGVDGDGAKVEFELTVDNRGTAEARQVTVSTFMLAAGRSEAERTLIEPDAAAGTPPIDIPAGEARTVQAAVVLPRSEIRGDSLLPVVVADASYRLPDGCEARISARFAVGLPNGEELAHFDAENPSGLHEGVVAHTLAEPGRS